MTHKQVIVKMLIAGELLTSETFCEKVENQEGHFLTTRSQLGTKIKELQTEGIRVKTDTIEKNGKRLTSYVLSRSKTSQEALNKYK